MKSRSSGYSSDSEQIKQDLSLLRKPIITSLNGFLEAKRAYENGTEEIRRLLSRECDIIYECKVCRNMFRSLTNFLSHKRVYCREPYNYLNNFDSNNKNGFIDQDISTIIQAEEDYVNNKNIKIPIKENSNSSLSSSVSATAASTKLNEKNNKDLSSVIERLVNRENENRLLKLSDFYDQVTNKLTKDEVLKKKHFLQLNRVPNSDVAVYQTIKENGNDNIQTEVQEIDDLLLKDNIVLGPDGKILQNCSKDIVQVGKILNNENGNTRTNDLVISCKICNLKFSTEKTLKLHIETKHITSSYVYQCPSCSQTFLQPGAVIRHLTNDHKKSMRRIRLMRETIYKRRMRLDEVQMKAPSRELARLQFFNKINDPPEDAQTKAWMDNIERSPKQSPFCTYCGKKFERKAVLNSHLNNCVIKSRQTPPVTQSAAKRAIDLAQIPPSVPNSSNSLIVKTEEKSNDSFEIEEICRSDILSSTAISDDLELKNRRKSPKPVEIRRKKLKKLKQEILESPPELVEISLAKEISRSMELSPMLKISPAAEVLEKPLNLAGDFKVKIERDMKVAEEPKIETFSNSTPVTPKIPRKKLSKRERLIKLFGTAKGISKNTDLTFHCRICQKSFDALSNLRRHISMFHYRRRKFGCKLCDYRAFRKYDVINHLGSVHSITSQDENSLLEYILITDDKNLKEDVDDDIVVSESAVTSAKAGNNEGSSVIKVRRKSKLPKIPKPSLKQDGETINVSTHNISEPISNIIPSPIPYTKRRNLSRSFTSKDDNTPKRPIRNRIKPVNKDFVYDLSNLLKKDIFYPAGTAASTSELLSKSKRRNTLIGDDIREIVTGFQSPKQNGDLNGKTVNNRPIKGSAQLMAKLAVSMFRACFNTPPELPTERPIIPSKILAQGRLDDDDENTAEVLMNFNGTEETSFLFPATKFRGFDEMKKIKQLRRISDDSIVRSLTANKKRRIELDLTGDSPSSRLLRKVDMNLNGNNSPSSSDSLFNKTFPTFTSKFQSITAKMHSSTTLSTPDNYSLQLNGEDGGGDGICKRIELANEKILVKCPTEKEFQEYLIANKLTDPVKKINIEFASDNMKLTNNCNSLSETNSQNNNKRITLLQRLAENKNKKLQEKESMLRSALEN